jgi:hypothetical protein
MKDLVTIKTYIYPYSLAIVKSLLDEERIFYFVKDELTVQTNPLYSNAVGGIKLQVRSEDTDRVISLLKESHLWDIEEVPGLNPQMKGKLRNYLLALLLIILLFVIYILFL